MRAVLVILTVFVIGIWAGDLPENERQNLKNIHEKCQSNSATHANEDLLKQLSQNVDNREVGAHMLCMSVGAGLQQQNGHFNVDTMKNKMSLVVDDKSQVDDLVTKCAVQKDTPEKTAVNMWMCFVQNHINYVLTL